MKLFPRLFFLAAPFFGIIIIGCGNWCDDCTEPDVWYRYVNQSNYELEMQPPEQIRKDTLRIPPGDSIEVMYQWLERSEFDNYKYVLHFRSLPESCLVFQGKIKDPTLDIRLGNYTRVDANSSNQKIVDRMVIGADHLQAASPCPTDSQFQL